MSLFNTTIARIGGLNYDSLEQARQKLDLLTKPQGSLGKLESLAMQVAAIRATTTPRMKHKTIFTLAADHGITEEGVSAFPQEVTAQMVENFLSEGAAINVLAKHVGAKVIVVDMGVVTQIKSRKVNFIDKKINAGTKNFLKCQAMTSQEAFSAIEAGITLVNDQNRRGLDIIGTGEMGIGNTTSSSAITALYTEKDVADVTGKGTGITGASLLHKIQVIRKALAIHKPDVRDPLDVLAKIGGFEIGGLVGVILGACAKRIPVVIDGFISSAAALLAFHLEPKVKDFLIASHCSVEKGHKAILEHIGLSPVLDLDLRLGEGTGAALAIGIVDASIKILTQMATFKSACVSKKDS
jgi:nicotinate-nucleotide--dimethylbenzimidazole phosphoribosyltransferase